MQPHMSKIAAVMLIAAAITTVTTISAVTASYVFATSDEDDDEKRDDKPHKGSNGQCRKLQHDFPPELQDYEGCHDSFTGKGHNDPDPLP